MGRLLASVVVALLASALVPARTAVAGEFDLSVNLRAVSSNSTLSRLNGEYGKLRFDGQHDGVQLGYLRFGYRADPTPTLRFVAEGVAYGDQDVNALDLTESYADWRPIPSAAWRSRIKVGAFYPEISLENRMRGWRSPYTLTNSAINTWIGEELRTIGAEYSLDWLGRANGHSVDISFNAALFGWNDTAGTVIAQRGWGLHDRQDTLFGRFSNRGPPDSHLTVFYDDLDKRAGFHAGITANYRGLLELHTLHYDNRANLAVVAPKLNDTTWLTYFDSLGLRWTPTADWTLISQWLHGRTYASDTPPGNAWSYDSEFMLASWKRGAMRYSARYDRFASEQTSSNFYHQIHFFLGDRGHGWTLATERHINDHWSIMLEGVAVTSRVEQRRFAGEPLSEPERQWQLAIRYDW